MLAENKSIFFLKKLFFHLYEGRKLKLIKYNKNIQKDLDISLINYKYFTKKYIIYEENGKGKEYYENGNLIYEGGYSNGKRNGKGKEYDKDDKLIFEGEYLKGKRNRKGKEYDKDGKLKFEGEFLNGKRNGKGKDYNFGGDLIFEGEYLNGKVKGDDYKDND